MVVGLIVGLNLLGSISCVRIGLSRAELDCTNGLNGAAQSSTDKAEYYSTVINDSSNDQKKLWQVL